ncbi:hypothetical protein BY996DRAFT_7196489 [Phakopsora pachyrhizi]|nr:hypothetical protein BY996DRAFT_7196489 [Phakopsora pachyrhizi]
MAQAAYLMMILLLRYRVDPCQPLVRMEELIDDLWFRNIWENVGSFCAGLNFLFLSFSGSQRQLGTTSMAMTDQ